MSHMDTASSSAFSSSPTTIFRPSAERGRTRIGWLESQHTFSFGDYFDPQWMSWRGLRVLNDDLIQAGNGFGEHGHHDMAILTWMLAGEIAHRDSLGNGDVLRSGDVQVMQAGRGIRHSEMNPSDQTTHLLQIWIQPVANGLPPLYGQRHIPLAERTGRWAVLADRDGHEGLPLGADARVLTAIIPAGSSLTYGLPAGRGAWLHLARGAATANGQVLAGGDGLGVTGTGVHVHAKESSEVLLFDLG